MSKDARLPRPMIDPEQVAEAILQAAAKHTRNRRSGTSSREYGHRQVRGNSRAAGFASDR